MRVCCQVISGCHGPVAAGQRTVAHAAGSLEPTGTHVRAHLGASALTGTVVYEAKGGVCRVRRVSTPHRSGHCGRNHAGAPAPTRRYNSLRRQR
jgi:hypothetical protein